MTRALSIVALVLLLGACRGADFFAEPIPLQDGVAQVQQVVPQQVVATTPESGGAEGGDGNDETDETIEAPLEIAKQAPPPQKRATFLAPNVFRPVDATVKKTSSPHWRSDEKALRLGFAIIDLEGRK